MAEKEHALHAHGFGSLRKMLAASNIHLLDIPGLRRVVFSAGQVHNHVHTAQSGPQSSFVFQTADDDFHAHPKGKLGRMKGWPQEHAYLMPHLAEHLDHSTADEACPAGYQDHTADYSNAGLRQSSDIYSASCFSEDLLRNARRSFDW